MVWPAAPTHDGDMSETPPEAGFDPHRVRGIADVKRSADDKMVAGVCSGMAKYLNIDPVIVRVILVALAFVGFSGLILYLAAWFFLPAEDEPRSIAARWFKLDDNEEQIRVIGLIVAGILAISAGTGIVGGDWSAPFPWLGLLIAAAAYLWILKPAQRRHERRRKSQSLASADDHDVTQVIPPFEPREPKTPWSPTLTFITLSTAFIAMGCVALWADLNESVPWTSYAVASLGVIGLGLLVGTWWGNGGVLIPIGGLIALALAASAVLPSARIGHDVFPSDPDTVSSSYTLGIGQLDLNLNDVSDQSALAGRTIKVRVGIGQTRIVVPRDVNVEVRSTLHAGEIRVFDRKVDGTQNALNYPAANATAAKLTLDLNQSIGNIEVIKR